MGALMFKELPRNITGDTPKGYFNYGVNITLSICGISTKSAAENKSAKPTLL